MSKHPPKCNKYIYCYNYSSSYYAAILIFDCGLIFVLSNSMLAISVDTFFKMIHSATLILLTCTTLPTTGVSPLCSSWKAIYLVCSLIKLLSVISM